MALQMVAQMVAEMVALMAASKDAWMVETTAGMLVTW